MHGAKCRLGARTDGGELVTEFVRAGGGVEEPEAVGLEPEDGDIFEWWWLAFGALLHPMDEGMGQGVVTGHADNGALDGPSLDDGRSGAIIARLRVTRHTFKVRYNCCHNAKLGGAVREYSKVTPGPVAFEGALLAAYLTLLGRFYRYDPVYHQQALGTRSPASK